jgi:hypothetical protein
MAREANGCLSAGRVKAVRNRPIERAEDDFASRAPVSLAGAQAVLGPRPRRCQAPARRSARLPAAPNPSAQQLVSSCAAASNASRNHGDREISEVSSTSTNQFAGTNEFASPSKAE